MSKEEEEARAAEYRRSTQARYNFYAQIEPKGSDAADIALHEDYDALLPASGWSPVERTFLKEEDVK